MSKKFYKQVKANQRIHFLPLIYDNPNRKLIPSWEKEKPQNKNHKSHG